jgi:hypothetical protein
VSLTCGSRELPPLQRSNSFLGQDNLHSGPSSPVSLTESDITALLPGNEDDFAHGREPKSRAALEGTPPAIANPKLVHDPHRSLFATLIQTHHLWGMISRRAVKQNKSSDPWDGDSDFAKMKRKLAEWEHSLPNDHTWSPVLLKGYKMTGQGLVGTSAGVVLCSATNTQGRHSWASPTRLDCATSSFERRTWTIS